MKHATSRILFAYWDALRGERSAPERGDLEPGEIRHILADTFILGIEPGGRATFRLAGTRCCALFGLDLKGAPLASLWSRDDRRKIDDAVEVVVADRCGLVIGVQAVSDLGHDLALEIVLLPLRHHGRTHARLVGSLSPLSVPTWIGLTPVSALETRSLRFLQGAREPVAPPVAPTDSALIRRQNFVVHEGGRSSAV